MQPHQIPSTPAVSTAPSTPTCPSTQTGIPTIEDPARSLGAAFALVCCSLANLKRFAVDLVYDGSTTLG